MEYQRYIRSRQIERAKKLLKNLDPETYKKGPHDVTRFIKRTLRGCQSGTPISATSLATVCLSCVLQSVGAQA